MARLHLVRHGRAAAAWDADLDPGLDDVGREQAEAAARRLAPLGPLDLLASPMRRTRETAAPLERLWGRPARVEPAVSEVPSSSANLAERGLWLRGIMDGTWGAVDPERRAWRDSVVAALSALREDSVIFTHYIAINVAVGAATRDDRIVCFRPDHCSVTVLETENGALRLVRLGAEAETVVR